MEEKIVQAKIPPDLEKLLGVESQSHTRAKTFTQAFLKNGLKQQTQLDPEDFLKHKALTLEYIKPKREKQQKKKNKTSKGLTARQKREMKIFQIKEEHQRYELFLPLHELWRAYIIDLCGLKPTSNPQLVQQKLLKADFHGAIISVIRSKCSSYVGTTGILLQEFKHVFKVITKEDKLKVIPKRNSVFAVEINGFVSHIYGSRFELRASERSAKKFKTKGIIDL